MHPCNTNCMPKNTVTTYEHNFTGSHFCQKVRGSQITTYRAMLSYLQISNLVLALMLVLIPTDIDCMPVTFNYVYRSRS